MFQAPPAAYAEPLSNREPGSESPLRIIHVEERAGVSRRGDLVRVPLFFTAGECSELADLAIVADQPSSAQPTSPVVWQADDIRRGDDGGISRVHLWFAVDLNAGEKRRYQLVRRSGASDPSAADAATRVDASARDVRFKTEEGTVVFSRRGELVSMSSRAGEWKFGDQGAAARIVLKYAATENQPAAEVIFDPTTPERTVEWESGPLFSKLRIKSSGEGETAFEQDFRIPHHGREVIVTQAIFPGARTNGVVRENRILAGRLSVTGGKVEVVRVPAGLRPALRAEHAYAVTGLSRRHAQQALLAIPLVVGGSNGLWSEGDAGEFTLQGQRNLQRGKEGEKSSLHAFWTEVRLVPATGATPDALWSTYLQHVQPLVAVVEEPGVTLEDLHAALKMTVREMKPIGWRQEAGRALVLGDEVRVGKILAQGPKEKEADPAALLRGAQNARAKLTNQGQRKLREDEKGRAYGGLDPYHITYTQSAAAALAVLTDAPPRVSQVSLAMAQAVRQAGGRVDAAGFPYIDCFNRTLNMQMGPVLFGLTAGAKAGDKELVSFYRDLATSPPTLAVFGRGQRPYTGAPARSSDQTDFLYQSICDLWLRTTELLGNENLNLHPLAYARYTDCIDVMADRYHEFAAQHKAELPGVARGNFFRGQAHTHRWLGWSAAPYIRLLEDPAEQATVGLTEAVRHTLGLKGRWKNWPDLTYYVLADLLTREALPRYARPELIDAPANVRVERRGANVALSWDAVEGAEAYRVYRTEAPGGPYRWLNSPHTDPAGPAIRQPRFEDAGAGEKSAYVVTAVDAHGRESRWPERAAIPNIR